MRCESCISSSYGFSLPLSHVFVSFFCLSSSLLFSQGSGPEDFSHLPPEQRRKKLQGKLDELNKDIQKEMDQRYRFIVLNVASESFSLLYMTSDICVYPINMQQRLKDLC